MFAEWASLSPIIAANSNGAQSQSVLNKFSGSAGREVAVAVVKQLAANLGLTQNSEPSCLNSDEEVLWCMDVICHGLSLPLTELETIRDCVNVYCDWLTALNPIPRVTVPKPICDDANLYARRIINHFHNIFVPRSGEGADTINRQAVVCHRVLRTLQQIAQSSQILTRETWESLLLFLLAINEVLLAPPTIKDDVGDQLCERVLSVLFELWLLACVRCFPSPSLWKTLQESCALLRHRIALIEQWNRVNLALTARLLEFTYGPLFPELKILEEDAQLIPSTMTDDCIAQTWYRFLRTIGSPIALCSPQVVSKTPQFMKWAITRADGMEPHQHPCLLNLPQIFLKAIKGIASHVDAFLGIYQNTKADDVVVDLGGGLQPLTSSSMSAIQQLQQQQTVTSTTTQAAQFQQSTQSSRYSVVEYKTPNRSEAFLVGNNYNSSSSSIGGGYSISNTTSGGQSGSLSGLSGISGNNQTNLIGGAQINSSSISTNINNDLIPHSPTPPLQRRLAKSFSVAPSCTQHKGMSKGSIIGLTSSRSSVVTAPPPAAPLTPNSGPPSTSSLTSLPSLSNENRPPLAPSRPKCNSILHLFGEWLFEAAYIGGDAWLQNTKKEATEASRRPSSMIMDNRKGSLSLSQPSSLTEPTDMPAGLTIDKYESGRAEAIGALCRIFCAKKTGEEILPVYLARFYIALQQGLKTTSDTKECEETMASILYNSADLFRLDLDGIQVLLPSFITALELVLPEKELRMRSGAAVNKNELRRASIHILLSILSLPLHFQSLPIRDLNSTSTDKLITFAQLKPRLINILMNALQVETDAQNTHMLLGGLLLCVQDSAIFEESDTTNELYQTSPAPSDTNLLSSACSEKSGHSVASANSSIGGNSTTAAPLGNNDFPSLTISDELPADLLQELEFTSIYDNAHALFVRATYLVCHRLISSWKTDLNVSLAALELLSGLARMHIKDSDALECKRAVKWICDYICYQCSRPPPAHSKDLHSTIVAAFQCTSAWLMQHSYLLQDKDCLTTVLEVVELGISGSKSIGKPGDSVKLKEEKELKPASMRVRDAAETLLTVILEQVGYFPSECGPQSSSSLLDEISLYKYCNSSCDTTDTSGSVNQEQAVQKFRYFVTENSTILALLEDPLGNDQDPQPTVTLLIRGPFGRHAWTMQLRHLPRSKSGGTKYHAPNPGRPVPMNDMPMRQEFEQRFFPDGVDRVQPCIADYSIPTLEAVNQKIGNESTKQLFRLLESQTVYEKLAWAETDNSVDSLSHAQESVPPSVCHEFQTARLFLSHFGFLSMDDADAKRNGDELTPTPQLTVLDTKKVGFAQDLQSLDKLSPRNNDTLHIFYVKAGQSKGQDIIDNQSEENVNTLDQHFWTVLLSLGWPVNVDEHAGWTGFLNNSWRINSNVTIGHQISQDNLYKYNGEKRVLYWADVGAEIAFVLPTKWNKFEETSEPNAEDSGSSGRGQAGTSSYERSISVMSQSGPFRMPIGQKPRTLSLELDKSKHQQQLLGNSDPVAPSRRRTTSSKPPHLNQTNAKILLVWLESFEDHLTFPVDDLLGYTKNGEETHPGLLPRGSDCYVIFIHSLNSGLLRVKLQGPTGRMSFATPLIDGMVISKRVVGSLVRQTVYNMAKRRRLDNDLYQPPHVRRRIKVQDIAHKYNLVMTEPELLAHLFKS